MLIASNFPQNLLLKFETESWTNHPRLTAADGDPGSDIINDRRITTPDNRWANMCIHCIVMITNKIHDAPSLYTSMMSLPAPIQCRNFC